MQALSMMRTLIMPVRLPSTWEELKLALLDILMPANSVEECAIKSATVQTGKGETVSASTLRFRALMSRFE